MFITSNKLSSYRMSEKLNLSAEAERLLLDTPRVDMSDSTGPEYAASTTSTNTAPTRAVDAPAVDMSDVAGPVEAAYTTSSTVEPAIPAAPPTAATPASMDMDDEDEVKIVFVSATSTPFSPSRVKKEPSTPSAKITSMSPLVRALPTMSTPAAATSQQLDIPMIDVGITTPVAHATQSNTQMGPPPVPASTTVAISAVNNPPPVNTASYRTTATSPAIVAITTTTALERASGSVPAATAAVAVERAVIVTTNVPPAASTVATPPLVDLTTSAPPPVLAAASNLRSATRANAPAARSQQRARARPRGRVARPRARGRFAADRRNGYHNMQIRDDAPEVVRLSHSVQREARASGIVIPEISIREFFNYWCRQTENYYRH